MFNWLAQVPLLINLLNYDQGNFTNLDVLIQCRQNATPQNPVTYISYDGKNIELSKVQVQFLNAKPSADLANFNGLYDVEGMDLGGKRQYFGALASHCEKNEQNIQCFDKSNMVISNAEKFVDSHEQVGYKFTFFNDQGLAKASLKLSGDNCSVYPNSQPTIEQAQDVVSLFTIPTSTIVTQDKIMFKMEPYDYYNAWSIEYWVQTSFGFTYHAIQLVDHNNQYVWRHAGGNNFEEWPGAEVASTFYRSEQKIDFDHDGDLDAIKLELVPGDPQKLWQISLYKNK